MGYCSDVGLSLTAKAKSLLDATLKESEQSNPNHQKIKNLFDSAEIHSDEASGDVAYAWNCTKWYEDFEEVKFVENFFNSLEPCECLFIRTGEDYDDIKHKGNFWESPLGMTLTRNVTFSYAG